MNRARIRELLQVSLLLAGVEVLYAVALILKACAVGAEERLPAIILALFLVSGHRAGSAESIRARIAGVAYAVAVRISLVGIRGGRAIINGVRNPDVVIVRITNIAEAVVINVRLICIGSLRAVVSAVSYAILVTIRLEIIGGDVAVMAYDQRIRRGDETGVSRTLIEAETAYDNCVRISR